MTARKIQIMLGVCAGLALLNIGRFYYIYTEQPLLASTSTKPTYETDAILFPHDRIARHDTSIVDRPLFEKNRQPFIAQIETPEIAIQEQVEVSNQDVISAPPSLPALSGVMNIDTRTFAFFEGDGEDARAVVVGEEINAWKVKEITAHEVILVYRETEEVLKIEWNQHFSMSESDKLPLMESGDKVLEEQGSLRNRLSRIMSQ